MVATRTRDYSVPKKIRFRRLDNGLLDLSKTINSQVRQIAQRHASRPELLKLPNELRNQIYGYVLGNFYIRKVQDGDRVHRNQRPRMMITCQRLRKDGFILNSLAGSRFSPLAINGYPKLWQVSRQLYNETAALPYSLNLFDLLTLGAYEFRRSRKMIRAAVQHVSCLTPQRLERYVVPGHMERYRLRQAGLLVADLSGLKEILLWDPTSDVNGPIRWLIMGQMSVAQVLYAYAVWTRRLLGRYLNQGTRVALLQPGVRIFEE
jgi:hypothetical protein